MKIDRKLNDKTVCAIGKVVVNFQQLEWTILSLIWLLSDNEEEAQRKTARQKFSWLCEELKSVFPIGKIAPTLGETFDGLMSQLKEVNEIRDQVVHSWWFKDHVGEQSRMKFVQRKSVQLDVANIDYERFAEHVRHLSREFERLLDELEAANIVRRIRIRDDEKI